MCGEKIEKGRLEAERPLRMLQDEIPANSLCTYYVPGLAQVPDPLSAQVSKES